MFTKWVDLKVGEVEVLIQVEEPHNKTGQDTLREKNDKNQKRRIGVKGFGRM